AAGGGHHLHRAGGHAGRQQHGRRGVHHLRHRNGARGLDRARHHPPRRRLPRGRHPGARHRAARPPSAPPPPPPRPPPPPPPHPGRGVLTRAVERAAAFTRLGWDPRRPLPSPFRASPADGATLDDRTDAPIASLCANVVPAHHGVPVTALADGETADDDPVFG